MALRGTDPERTSPSVLSYTEMFTVCFSGATRHTPLPGWFAHVDGSNRGLLACFLGRNFRSRLEAKSHVWLGGVRQCLRLAIYLT